MAKDTPKPEEIDEELIDLEDLVDDEEEPETDETEGDEESDEEEAPQGVRPVDLAKELGINPKSLRAFLRQTFPRSLKLKNTSWYLNEDQVAAVIARFTPSDDDETVEDEGVEE